jgi:taurine dioxygenase
MPDIQPMTGRIGAEIGGADLRRPIGEDLAAALRAALHRYHVIVFRRQHLDLAQQKALTRVFGPLSRSRYISSGIEGEPDVIRVLKEADERGGVFGGDWHSDLSFLDKPPAGSVLSAHEVPPYGGDTVWASQVAAWESLPERLKRLLDGRKAIHVGKPYGVKWAPPAETRSGASIRMVRGDPEADEERFHPAVLTDPEDGRWSLFLNPIYTVRLDGMSEAESQPVLDEVQRHVTRPEFCVRLRWGAGDVAVWDNFATQHYAVNDYHGFRRLMYRTAFGGPKPV